ncbi:SRPBCC family protein [Nakamurella aerolata]|uniref:Polyketide cyclase n=1 Tax=Nakamurella aerolata TaxID=1656892 RepID=A0A849AB37_9ACTN|nr:SRPBCC family protein [Nakamurella aerolata]NNG36351.1 hypothetical protein [Nakamurella aerolata]
MGRAARAERIVIVTRTIDASPATLFNLLADPHQHQRWDGSGMVDGNARGPDRLHLGDTFTMQMHQSRVRYRSVNEVIELDPDKSIAWRTLGRWRGRRVIGGQVWRYQLVPTEDPDGRRATLVIHSYDWGAAMAAPVLALLGYPRRMGRSMAVSLQRLAEAASSFT